MYKEYYQFSNSPFQITPHSELFFSSQGHKKVLTYLQQSLSQGNGFIVITGGLGLGKTTLINKNSANLDTKQYIVKQIPISKLSKNNLLTVICEMFELMYQGLRQEVLLKQFHSFLRSINKLGRKVILIIDDAQTLRPMILQQLKKLFLSELDNKPLLQIYLVGEKKLLAILQKSEMEGLKQYILTSCHLSPLKEDEVKDYIHYRLNLSGWAGQELFDIHAFSVIYQLTHGIPRRINLLCDRVLLLGYLEGIQFFTAEHIKSVAQELKNELASPIKKGKFHNDKKKNKVIQKAMSSDSSDFVDIEETIKQFDLSIEKEIQEYKNTLNQKN